MNRVSKEFNSHRTGLKHQHTRSSIVLKHQYGRRDVNRSTIKGGNIQHDLEKNTSYKCNNGSIEDLRKLPTHTALP